MPIPAAVQAAEAPEASSRLMRSGRSPLVLSRRPCSTVGGLRRAEVVTRSHPRNLRAAARGGAPASPEPRRPEPRETRIARDLGTVRIGASATAPELGRDPAL